MSEQVENFVGGQIGVFDQAAAAQARADRKGAELLGRAATERLGLQVAQTVDDLKVFRLRAKMLRGARLGRSCN